MLIFFIYVLIVLSKYEINKIKMFRGITENPDKPEGKFANENTLFGKATHFEFGKPEWN